MGGSSRDPVAGDIMSNHDDTDRRMGILMIAEVILIEHGIVGGRPSY